MRYSVAVFSLVFLGFTGGEPVKQISLEYNSRILEKGKYITVAGEVYFRKSTGLMTTRLTRPFEMVTIVNSQGEVKIHDPSANTLVQNRSAMNSSEGSYLWHFLNGSYNDLGLAKTGYVIKTSKPEDGLMVTTWVPKQGFSSPIGKIELVHEKSLPVYIGYMDHQGKMLGKMYFSAFTTSGDVVFPSKITEIMYRSLRDSVITTKSYSEPRINNEVDLKYLDYKIPANAKIVEQ